MCNVLSMCVTKDHKVLAVPGKHHHSEIVKHALDRGLISAHDRGSDLVGIEMAVRDRVVVLDEGTLPAWYGGAHDRALWEWLQENVAGPAEYREWLAQELVHGVGTDGDDLAYACAPLGVSVQRDLVRNALPHPCPGTTPGEGLARETVAALEERAASWASAWEDPGIWTVSFDRANLHDRGPDASARVLRPEIPGDRRVMEMLAGFVG